MEELETLKILHIQAIDYFHVKTALEIQHNNMISYWDSLIIAAAQTAKCSILYSEDLNNGQTIAGVKVVNPLEE